MCLGSRCVLPCQAQVVQKGLLAAPNRDLWCIRFLEKFLADSQIVTELCRFGKGSSLARLLYAAGARPSHPNLVILLTCAFDSWWPCPAEFSSTGRRECFTELGPSDHIPLRGSSLGLGLVLGCAVEMQGGGDILKWSPG